MQMRNPCTGMEQMRSLRLRFGVMGHRTLTIARPLLTLSEPMDTRLCRVKDAPGQAAHPTEGNVGHILCRTALSCAA
jgi:hypothetical protein